MKTLPKYTWTQGWIVLYESNQVGEDSHHNDIIADLPLDSHNTICVGVIIGHHYIKLSHTASIHSGSIILHEHRSHAILEWLIELAETTDGDVDELIDLWSGLFFVIWGVGLFVHVFLLDSEQVVYCVLQDLHHLFRNELFLDLSEDVHRRLGRPFPEVILFKLRLVRNLHINRLKLDSSWSIEKEKQYLYCNLIKLHIENRTVNYLNLDFFCKPKKKLQ